MPEQTRDAAAAERGRRVALLVEYDGARFAGSQLQANAITVQGVLEEAILKATEAPSRAALAGRTDSGVHARGQVAAFDTASRLDGETLRRALNAWLPDDVAVRAVAEVAASFDPRRAARRRWYRYVIDNGDVRPAFASRLEDASASTVRELYSLDVTREGTSIIIDAEANAFLPHQVRRMTGALVEVGRGKLGADGFALLLKGPPASAGPAAPPHGLYLMRVVYEPEVFRLDSSGFVC